jgi:hypothetical protein
MKKQYACAIDQRFPNLPIFLSPEKADLVIKPTLEGMAKAATPRSLNDFDIAPYAKIRIGDDLPGCRCAVKPELALYIGGMDAVGKNFYNDYSKRLGFPDAAAAIQKAFLAGHRKEALAAVPDALGSVEIWDSQLSLFVIQALDGSLCID